MGRNIGGTCKAALAFGVFHRTLLSNWRATLQVVLALQGHHALAHGSIPVAVRQA